MEMKTALPLSSVIDLLLDAVCVVDAAGRFVYVSAACERIFGYSPEEMLGKSMIEMVVPEDRERTLQAARQIMSGQAQPHFENRYLRKDGEIVYVMWSARWSETDQLRIAVAHDVTERKRAESVQAAIYAISEAAHAAEDLPALFQQIHQIIGQLLPAHNFYVALYDEDSGQLSFPYHVDSLKPDPAIPKPASGTLCAEVIRTHQPLLLTRSRLAACPVHLIDAFGQNVLCWLGVPLNTGRGTIGALVLKSYSGEACYTEKDQDLLQYVSTQVATAIERKQLHTRLQFMAQYDALTHLPNRRLLHDRLESALMRARREHWQFSLLYLDLDKFKQINDTFGHVAGDLLLQAVARRLKQCVRESDTVARVGGDEFVVLLESTLEPEHVAVVVDKLHKAFESPLDIAGHSLSIQPSIGIAHYPEHGEEAQQLLKYADEAMYYSKHNEK